jgi:hypothetical protein
MVAHGFSYSLPSILVDHLATFPHKYLMVDRLATFLQHG